ncbi:MAG TPA: DUF4349 domain-containing protein [Gemmatimonadaceae bacterium]|nr:DUF4349 domain-containing protein [Gemmatimonadaceae bacterium]
MRRWTAAGVVSLALWAAGAACNSGREAARAGAARGSAGSTSAYAPAREEKAVGVAADAAPTMSPMPAAPPGAQRPVADSATVAPSMIIRTGSASIEVDSLEPAVARVRQLAQRVGGFIANTSMQTGHDQLRAATLEVKLPAQRWEEAVRGLQPIGRVESVSESTQDVGEEYVDVSARVANARRLEERLVELLARRTGKLEDVLAVERELARVREEIERYEGRLRYLRTRAAVSTLAVTVHEPPPLVGRTPGDNPITEAFRAAWRNFVEFIAMSIAALGWLIPLALVVAAAVWLARRLGLRGRRPEPPGERAMEG